MKLFIENPVSLIQMAYNKNHPSEEDARNNVIEEQKIVKKSIEIFKLQSNSIFLDINASKKKLDELLNEKREKFGQIYE